jgi:opacity protein-like surface antigen
MNKFLGALVIALIASPAMAADLGRGGMKDDAPGYIPSEAISWTGFYIGGQVGYGNSNHKITGDATNSSCGSRSGSGNNVIYPRVGSDGQCYNSKDLDPKTNAPVKDAKPLTDDAHAVVVDDVASAFVDGFNSKGVFGGATVGGDIQMGRIVVGVFGDYDFGNGDAKTGATLGSGPGSLGANGSIKDGDSWLVAARVGYLFGEEKRALLYALGGYGQQDVSYHGDIGQVGNPTAGGAFDKDVTFGGFVAGAGAEYALSRNIFIGLEWQHFFGGKETLYDSGIVSGGNRLLVQDDMDSDKVMAKLKIKLNGFSNPFDR